MFSMLESIEAFIQRFKCFKKSFWSIFQKLLQTECIWRSPGLFEKPWGGWNTPSQHTEGDFSWTLHLKFDRNLKKFNAGAGGPVRSDLCNFFCFNTDLYNFENRNKQNIFVVTANNQNSSCSKVFTHPPDFPGVKKKQLLGAEDCLLE